MRATLDTANDVSVMDQADDEIGAAAFAELAEAIAAGGAELAGLLVRATPEAVAATDAAGHTLLGLAIARGDAAACALLLAHGANVNEVSFEGDTALSLAITQDRADLVELLCRHGAVVGHDPYLTRSNLFVALRHRATFAIAVLLRHGANMDAALIEAASALDPNACELAWALGARAVDPALRAVVLTSPGSAGRLAVARLLLACGGEPEQDLRGPPGETLMHRCARLGDGAMLGLLLQAAGEGISARRRSQALIEVARDEAAAVLRAWLARATARTTLDARVPA